VVNDFPAEIYVDNVSISACTGDCVPLIGVLGNMRRLAVYIDRYIQGPPTTGDDTCG